MTLLDEIIDASTGESRSTSDLLRMVRVAAHRLGAIEISTWAQHELSGYPDDGELPDYRVQATSVLGIFAGPARSEIRHNLQRASDDFLEWFSVEIRQPISELESFASAESDAVREWPAWLVQKYERDGFFRMNMHVLFSAHNVIPRQRIHGLIDTVKTRVLDFALELQSDFPAAGSVDGPTVNSEPSLARTVNNITNNITGHGTNVAIGSETVRQHSSVTVGDVAALRSEAEDLGLTADAAHEFATAVETDRSVDGPAVKHFLERVRRGSITLSSAVASDVVAGSLVELAKGFLGLA
ncbi:hypothetical protein E3T61_20020 [Cryobacterium lactosi]|uniref:AbiTii domain-containing protein n=1 Tax=Cryobacterium lactosi TaxID=1259202 RepID=A0A4R9BH61_9MICO|nr:hypothetical protein [Cryobacterium lactosi]TFD84055.1 hypothetical protein E3T61_20020 [Cryobacterium lactosi]